MNEEELARWQEDVLPRVKKRFADKKKEFDALWKQRAKADSDVWKEIENDIFQKKYKMQTKAYHGGDKYNGVDIGFLMDKSMVISNNLADIFL